MTTLIAIQDRYVATVNAGRARWAHRRDGGHLSRIRRGARRTAEHALARLGYTPGQAAQAVSDARDMAELEWLARHAD